MICEQVRKHQKERGGLIDLNWLEKHVETCKECQATLEVLSEQVTDYFTSEDD